MESDLMPSKEELKDKIRNAINGWNKVSLDDVSESSLITLMRLSGESSGDIETAIHDLLRMGYIFVSKTERYFREKNPRGSD
jgi:hypothetical protein